MADSTSFLLQNTSSILPFYRAFSGPYEIRRMNDIPPNHIEHHEGRVGVVSFPCWMKKRLYGLI
ncbi:MAG: hypothetical protein PHQ81_03670 [Methanofollis sp.]|nr:hypothetical protein [Methanofollis sp.]